MKGLAIIGVVAGHLGYGKLEIFVNYWHLPVFFFVSGYFFKQKHIDNPAGFAVSRVKRLLIPFFLLATAALLLHNPLADCGIISGGTYGFRDMVSGLKQIFLTLSCNQEIAGAIWFLPILFIVSMIALTTSCFIKYCISSKYEWGGVITAVIGVAALLLRLPSLFWVWSCMVLTSLFFFGQTCSRFESLNKLMGKWPVIVLSCALLGYGVANDMHIGCQFWSVEAISVWHFLLFLSGICVISALSEAINDSRIGKYIAYIGEYSFSIMALHLLAFKAVTLIHHHYDMSVPLNSFPTCGIDLNYWSAVYLISGIALPILCAKSYTKVKDMLRSGINFVSEYKRTD